nr:ATP-binding cassette sub-family G member 1-like isoform X1 [Onthophagus taurus]
MCEIISSKCLTTVQERVNIEFDGICYNAKQNKVRKQILSNLTGSFKFGEMTAIMGPSGAGKSTLLNILTGYQRKGVIGGIRKVSCYTNAIITDKLRKNSCYIMQDDRLNPLFTVWEIMSIAADLKRGRNLTKKSKENLIDEILTSLALTTCKNTRCGMLSGGQKKRLSIALELIDNPPVMFLDEPTTGLDSLSTYQCISILRNLAKAGRTIICTIHQPSATIFEMFDQIYVLAKGQCVYSGPPTRTVEYLSNLGLYCPKYHNPADYLIETANCDYGDLTDLLVSFNKKTKFEEGLISKEYGEDVELTLSNKDSCKYEPPSEFYKFSVLLKRTFLHLYRDWTVTQLRLALHTLIGTFLGIIFLNYGSDGSKSVSNAGFLLITSAYLTYTAMMPAVLKFPLELPVIKREQFNNWYKLRTYYASFLVSHIPIQVIFCIAYACVAYFLSAQPAEANRFFMFVLICCLISISAEGMGTVLGTVVNPVNGTFIGAVSCAVMIVVGGFLCFYPHMPKVFYIMSYFSYISYGTEAFMQIIYGFDRPALPCPSEEIYCHYRVPQRLLKEMGMDKPTFWENVLSLCIFVVVFRVMAFLTLKRKLS